MRERIRKARRNGLLLFLITWIAVIWFMFVLLAGGLMLATFKLRQQNLDMERQNKHLQTTVMLELEVLSLGRQVSIRPRFTKADFKVADQLKNQLVQNADSPKKQELTLKVMGQYGEFQKKALAGIQQGQADLNDAMYSNLQSLRAINRQQLDQMHQTASQINNLTQWWSTVMVIVVGLFLIWGILNLWSRFFKPILALSRTARAIGDGHMKVRAPVLRDDELGALSKTFNVMANAMEDREKERMHFVATVAHDLKNPLVVIGGLAHLLEHKEENAKGSEQSEWLRIIIQNTKKLEQSIAELADTTQASMGQVQLNLQEIDLREIVEKIVTDRREVENSHELKYEIQEVPKIEGDPQKIGRVVLNLLSNAIKYSDPGSVVSIRLHSNDKWVILHISDQGAGMSHEDLKKIFIPFVRLEHTQKMAQGTGLGLLSVKKIVEAHGGKIRFHSQINKGTRVVVQFPKT